MRVLEQIANRLLSQEMITADEYQALRVAGFILSEPDDCEPIEEPVPASDRMVLRRSRIALDDIERKRNANPRRANLLSENELLDFLRLAQPDIDRFADLFNRVLAPCKDPIKQVALSTQELEYPLIRYLEIHPDSLSDFCEFVLFDSVRNIFGAKSFQGAVANAFRVLMSTPRSVEAGKYGWLLHYDEVQGALHLCQAQRQVAAILGRLPILAEVVFARSIRRTKSFLWPFIVLYSSKNYCHEWAGHWGHVYDRQAPVPHLSRNDWAKAFRLALAMQPQPVFSFLSHLTKVGIWVGTEVKPNLVTVTHNDYGLLGGAIVLEQQQNPFRCPITWALIFRFLHHDNFS